MACQETRRCQMPCKTGFCVTSLTQNAALRPQGGAGAKRSFVKIAANGGNEPKVLDAARCSNDQDSHQN